LTKEEIVETVIEGISRKGTERTAGKGTEVIAEKRTEKIAEKKIEGIARKWIEEIVGIRHSCENRLHHMDHPLRPDGKV